MPRGKQAGIVLGIVVLVAVAATSAIARRNAASGKPDEAGQAARYKLSQTLHVATDHAEEVAAIEVSGELELAAFGAVDGGQLVRATISQPSLSAAGVADELREQYRQALLKPCYYRLEPNGSIVQVYTARGLPSAVQGLWKSILAELQLGEPHPIGNSWRAQERDGAGEYTAQYERGESDNFTKHKLEYAAPTDPMSPQQRIVKSETSFTRDADGLLRVDAEEQTRAELPQLPAFVSETHLHLERVRRQDVAVPHDLQALLSDQIATKLSEPPSADARRADQDHELAGHANASELLPLLGSDKQEERTQAYQRLVSLLRVDDSAVTAVAQAARGDGQVGQWALSALGDASTAATTRELQTLLSDKSLPNAKRQAALTSLGRAELASSAGADLVTKLLDDPDLGFQAKLSVGSMIFRLQQTNPDEAKRRLQVLLDGALGQQHRIEFLKALGNAGHPDSLPVLEKITSDPDALVRAAAVAALRRLPGPGVEELLLRVLANDSSPQVREAALGCLEQHDPSDKVVSAALLVAKSDPKASVQIKAIGVLANFGRKLQTVETRAALAELAERQAADEQVRTSARHALERLNQPG